jgi:hypothetical protein
VPDVHIRTAGLAVALAYPRAKNAAERSSTNIFHRAFGFLAMAMVSGVEREPGEMQKKSAPWRINSSTRTLLQSEVICRLFIASAS